MHRAAYGAAVLEDGIPCVPATCFRLASVSKQFTALLIAQLSERGALGYDDPIARFFDGAPELWRRVTVRQLLCHTSGLWDYEELIPPDATEQLRDADVLRLVTPVERGYAEPGAAYRYSNTAYCLLALIAERVAGARFAELLRERIFAPLEMGSTVAHEAGVSQVANRAYGYSRAGGGFARTDQSLTSATLGDGGIYSCVDDLARWDAALAEGRLVSAATMAAILHPWAGAPAGEGYGFGWFLAARGGAPLAYHTGETTGFRTAIVRRLDRRLSAVVLCNRSEAEPLALAHALLDLHQ